MPYCPKCDMEFIKGVTVCSDCGGSLFESKEEALAVQNASQPGEPDALPPEYPKEDASTEESGELPRQEKPARPPAVQKPWPAISRRRKSRRRN